MSESSLRLFEVGGSVLRMVAVAAGAVRWNGAVLLDLGLFRSRLFRAGARASAGAP